MIGNIRKEKAWFLLAYKESNKLTSYNLGKQQGNGKGGFRYGKLVSRPAMVDILVIPIESSVGLQRMNCCSKGRCKSNAMGCADRHMLNGEMQVGHGQLHPSLLTGTLIQRLSSFKS